MKEKFLRELADIQTGPFGSQLHKEDYVADGTPIVTVEHLGNKMFSEQNLPRVSNTDKNRLKKYVLKQGDIVFSRVGSVDRCSYVDQKHDGWMFSGRCLRVRPTSEIDSEYLYYYFCLEETKQFVRNIAVGATMPSINTKLLGEVVVTFPELEQQKRISGILSAIDSKIEVNQKINDNLEQQAATYFQELFINNANPVWQISTISDLGTVVGGSTPSKTKPEYYTNNGIAWITPKDLSINKSKFISHGENDITELGLKNSSATVMPKGTVLFSSRAPIGYIAIASNEVTTNQGFKSVIPYSEIGTAFVYFFLKHSLPVIESAASGSTFKEISGSAMKNIPAIIPDRNTLDQFNSFCAPIFAQQKILEEQNHSLAMLRDSLLPKLMSGAIDIASIQL
mgnify:FL=1|jgi:type I restriction enzyme S subunit